MRIAAFGATLLIAFAACTTTNVQPTESPYLQPNSLMAGEISRRVEQIPYLHRDELLQNLMWLAQTGEQTITTLLKGMQHESPKVRSSCAWVLGRIADRRVIPELQECMKDKDPTVRMEVARTLVLMGDIAWSPTLIEGLDSDRKEVRYLCHEALKTSTGHDFGYDHLSDKKDQMQLAVLRWRQWWSEYSGDAFFAKNYQEQHHLVGEPATPMGETKSPNETPANPTPAPNENHGQVELQPDPNQPPAIQTPGTAPMPRPNGGQ